MGVACNLQVIVISLGGPLCSDKFLDSAKSASTQLMSFGETENILRVLLRHFIVGIWSTECPTRLMEAVKLLLPPDILSRILFVCPSYKSRKPYDFCYFVNIFKKASISRRTGQYLWPKCVVVADLDPLKNPRLAIVHYLQYQYHQTGRLRGICKALRLK